VAVGLVVNGELGQDCRGARAASLDAFDHELFGGCVLEYGKVRSDHEVPASTREGKHAVRESGGGGCWIMNHEEPTDSRPKLEYIGNLRTGNRGMHRRRSLPARGTGRSLCAPCACEIDDKDSTGKNAATACREPGCGARLVSVLGLSVRGKVTEESTGVINFLTTSRAARRREPRSPPCHRRRSRSPSLFPRSFRFQRRS